MRKWLLVILSGMMLCGCGRKGELETVMDSSVVPAPVEQMEVIVSLPKDAMAQVLSSEEGSIYFCGDYTLTMQTVSAGDLNSTFLDATGYLPEQLSVIKTEKPDYSRYDCVWTSAGEQGDQVGRCAVLDDGHYHYVLTLMADASKVCALSAGEWREVMDSFCLAHPEEEINIGS